MKQLLFATLVVFVIVLLCPSSQAEHSPVRALTLPAVIITEPKANKVIKLGDTLHIAWNVSGSFAHPDDWDLFVYLQDCAIDRISLYEGPFVKAPNYLNWTLTKSEVTPQMERGDADSLKIRVCLYNRRAGNDELLAMSLSCKAGLSREVFVCKSSSSTVALKP